MRKPRVMWNSRGESVRGDDLMDRLAADHPHIRINQTIVYLDREALAEGEFRIESGCLSELCEDCGADIAETGTLYGGKDGSSVLCDELSGGCGAFYVVEGASAVDE